MMFLLLRICQNRALVKFDNSDRLVPSFSSFLHATRCDPDNVNI